jgi:acyl-coenzyme A thioesterase PaaI-like protein
VARPRQQSASSIKFVLLCSSVQFTALLKTSLVKDMLFLLNIDDLVAYLAIDLGPDVCGHAKIVHGGLLSAICDETLGSLVYGMKQKGILGPEPAVTANLSINYRKVRTNTHVRIPSTVTVIA